VCAKPLLRGRDEGGFVGKKLMQNAERGCPQAMAFVMKGGRAMGDGRRVGSFRQTPQAALAIIIIWHFGVGHSLFFLLFFVSSSQVICIYARNVRTN